MQKSTFVTREKLDDVSLQARQSPRLRKNYNFHLSDEDPCHRLLNAMEPGSYIQPHRHGDIHKDEAMVALRGKMGVIFFDEEGNVESKALMTPSGDIMMVDIPHGKFHTVVSLEAGSVFFEAKSGPYRLLTPEEKAPWAPEENQGNVSEYVTFLCNLFKTDRK